MRNDAKFNNGTVALDWVQASSAYPSVLETCLTLRASSGSDCARACRQGSGPDSLRGALATLAGTAARQSIDAPAGFTRAGGNMAETRELW